MYATLFQPEDEKRKSLPMPLKVVCAQAPSGHRKRAFYFLKIECPNDELTIHFEDAEAMEDWALRLATALKLARDDNEAARVADPAYVPTVDEAARHPKEFVEGMTETML